MLDVTSPFFLDAPHLYGRPSSRPFHLREEPILPPPDRRAAQEGGRGSTSKVRVRGRDGAPDAAAVAGRGPPPSPAAKGAGAGAGGETALAGGQRGAAPGAANAAAADASAAATPAGAAAARIHPAKKKRAGGARSDAGCAPCRRGAAATQALCGSAPPRRRQNTGAAEEEQHQPLWPLVRGRPDGALYRVRHDRGGRGAGTAVRPPPTGGTDLGRPPSSGRKRAKEKAAPKKKAIAVTVVVEDASDSECEDDSRSPWRNRRPGPGQWIEPVELESSPSPSGPLRGDPR